MSKTFLKNILKVKAILTLSFVLSSSNTLASDMPDEEKQIIVVQSSNADDLQLALPINNNTLFSLPGKFFGVQEELALYNKSQYAVHILNSEDFKNALNNLLTWAAYNESKRLYQQHGDKFIAPLADTLINTNFALAKSLLLKTTGLSDVVKAVGILVGEDFSLPKTPSAYIRENYSQSFFDICRLKFLTDALNEKIIAPHIVAPCLAYAVHKTDIAGIIQQHIISKIQIFLEEQKPGLEKKAKSRLGEIDSEIVSLSSEMHPLREKIKNWEESPEAIEIQNLLEQNATEIKAAQRQQQAQQQIVDDECKQMSNAAYYLNYLPGMSTDNQNKLSTLKQETQQLLSTEKNLKERKQKIKTALEYQVGSLKKEKRYLKKEKNAIIMGLKGEDIGSRTISYTKVFTTGFLQESEDNISDNNSIFETTFAGMSWLEVIQPCPHVNYQYLQWIESQWSENGTQPQEETSESSFRQSCIKTATQMGTSYCEITGLTKTASDLCHQLSPEKLEKNKQKLFKIYERDKETSTKNAQSRADIFEDNNSSRFTKTAHLGGLYFQDIKNTVFKYGHMSLFVTAHADLLKQNVISFGNALRTAARPITVTVQALKYTAPVWAVSYITSYVFEVSMPYGTGLIVPLALGVMDDFGLWEPTLEYAAETKNALVSRLTHTHSS